MPGSYILRLKSKPRKKEEENAKILEAIMHCGTILVANGNEQI